MIVQTVACHTHPSGMLGPIAARLVHALTTFGGLLSFLRPCHSASAVLAKTFHSYRQFPHGPATLLFLCLRRHSLPLTRTPPLAGTVDLRVPPKKLALECDEEDILSASMANFRCREFARAAHTLSACGSTRARFL